MGRFAFAARSCADGVFFFSDVRPWAGTGSLAGSLNELCGDSLAGSRELRRRRSLEGIICPRRLGRGIRGLSIGEGRYQTMNSGYVHSTPLWNLLLERVCPLVFHSH